MTSWRWWASLLRCVAYWYPIYALIRRRGHTPEESRDLAQDYFTRLLDKGVLAAADR